MKINKILVLVSLCLSIFASSASQAEDKSFSAVQIQDINLNDSDLNGKFLDGGNLYSSFRLNSSEVVNSRVFKTDATGLTTTFLDSILGETVNLVSNSDGDIFVNSVEVDESNSVTASTILKVSSDEEGNLSTSTELSLPSYTAIKGFALINDEDFIILATNRTSGADQVLFVDSPIGETVVLFENNKGRTLSNLIVRGRRIYFIVNNNDIQALLAESEGEQITDFSIPKILELRISSDRKSVESSREVYQVSRPVAVQIDSLTISNGQAVFIETTNRRRLLRVDLNSLSIINLANFATAPVGTVHFDGRRSYVANNDDQERAVLQFNKSNRSKEIIEISVLDKDSPEILSDRGDTLVLLRSKLDNPIGLAENQKINLKIFVNDPVIINNF